LVSRSRSAVSQELSVRPRNTGCDFGGATAAGGGAGVTAGRAVGGCFTAAEAVGGVFASGGAGSRQFGGVAVPLGSTGLGDAPVAGTTPPAIGLVTAAGFCGSGFGGAERLEPFSQHPPAMPAKHTADTDTISPLGRNTSPTFRDPPGFCSLSDVRVRVGPHDSGVRTRPLAEG
jgi:hypothetical protein